MPSHKLLVVLIGFALGAIGVILMLDAGVSWKALVGLAFILWGNNMSQARPPVTEGVAHGG